MGWKGKGDSAESLMDSHVAASDPHAGYVLNSELTSHEGAVDPHTVYMLESAIVTTVGSPGSDTSYPSEQAVREAITASETPSVTTKTGDYLAAITDDVILVNATSNDVDITLPAVASSSSMLISVKRIDGSGYAVTIDANASELIDGEETQTIDYQYDCLTIVCDGSAWYII